MTRKVTKRRAAPEQDKMIADALRGVGRPVSAYELIEELRDKASLAPQTVYRSLDRLIADGQAHRLESINAFVACRHPSHDHDGAAVLRHLQRLRHRHRVRRAGSRRPPRRLGAQVEVRGGADDARAPWPLPRLHRPRRALRSARRRRLLSRPTAPGRHTRAADRFAHPRVQPKAVRLRWDGRPLTPSWPRRRPSTPPSARSTLAEEDPHFLLSPATIAAS
ncbi:MAG: hypothetical protein WDN31_16205 [Hyphomicrobium sp.]